MGNETVGGDLRRSIDRFVNNAYDLVTDGESYRPRLKPNRRAGQKAKV